MNLYPVILAAVALGGFALTVWGWLILKKSRTIAQWPQAAGKIVASNPTSSENDLLPEIIFSYRVKETDYQTQFVFPEGTHPLPEFSKAYNDKYPTGKMVTVFYNPDNPDNATLEPSTQGDWMILAMGIAMLLGGILSLVFV